MTVTKQVGKTAYTISDAGPASHGNVRVTMQNGLAGNTVFIPEVLLEAWVVERANARAQDALIEAQREARAKFNVQVSSA